MIPAGLAVVVVLGLVIEAAVFAYAEYRARKIERAFWERQRAQASEAYDWAKELDL